MTMLDESVPPDALVDAVRVLRASEAVAHTYKDNRRVGSNKARAALLQRVLGPVAESHGVTFQQLTLALARTLSPSGPPNLHEREPGLPEPEAPAANM